MPLCSIDFTMKFGEQEWKYCFYIDGDATQLADRYSNEEILATVQFWDALLYIHGAGVKLSHVAVANVEEPGKGESRTRYINKSNPLGLGSTGSRVTDVTGNSLLSSMFGTANRKRKFTMSGLPDAMIERGVDGAAIRNAMFNDAWAVIHPIMLNQDFKIRFAQEPTPEQLKRVRLMEPATVAVGDPPVNVEDPSHTLFTTTVAHGFSVGDTIDFVHREPTRATEELTGTFKVVEIPGESVTKFVAATRINFRGSSYVPKELYVFEPTFTSEEIASWHFNDWGTRQRGQGGGPRGRSRNRRRKSA